MTTFLPLDRMWERLRVECSDSDAARFLCLMYLGEMLTKFVVSGLVACIEDDVSRSRYRQLYSLVRADGIGEWVHVLDEIAAGPTAQFLAQEARVEQRELTERVKSPHWGYEACAQMCEAQRSLGIECEPIPERVDTRRLFTMFATLRNRTRGHGATRAGLYTAACPKLETALRLFCNNFSLLRRPWAYLRQNLSGKYRVTAFTEDDAPFRPLRSTPSTVHLEDGVYIYAGSPRIVELVKSDVDATDFLFPNGRFNGKRFEVRSYLSDAARDQDATPYLRPASLLPESETMGKKELDAVGAVLTNLPPQPTGYVPRPRLQDELMMRLSDDRHPVITLLGRGGIGKTSLALTTLHQLTAMGRFEVILWFSARDIDLIQSGPKLVQPQVLSIPDIARDFVRLTAPKEDGSKGFRSEEYFSRMLSTPLLGATLFVFDNFETIRNPIDVYTWLSEYVRLPNKILITTRIRDFKADYPVEVQGMTPDESDVLITQTANALAVSRLFTPELRRELIDQAEGHPYILKILVGQVAVEGKAVNIQRVIAGKEEILDALFERTFLGLSAAAQRVFLTLSGWRSAVPEMAVEAVLAARSAEILDVEAAIGELTRWSLVEHITSPVDREGFLIVPLAAAAFGRRKLLTSPSKSAIEADLEVLHHMGGMQRTEVRHGATLRLRKLAHTLVQKVARDLSLIEEYTRILEFLAPKVPTIWLELSRLYEEEQGDYDRSVHFAQRFIEAEALSIDEKRQGWSRLAELYRRCGNGYAEINALVERAQLGGTLSEISTTANVVNSVLRSQVINDQAARHGLVQKLIKAFEEVRSNENYDATDLSRLAWLYLRVKNESSALLLAREGLEMDPDNSYCKGLLEKLG